MAKIKLISDFDGIWTNQDIEAEYVRDYIVNTLSELTGFDSQKTISILNECRKEMNKKPYRFGWFNNDKIAVYFNEDPFGDNNAIFDFINRLSTDDTDFKKMLTVLKESVLKKYTSLADFSQECFMKSTKKFKDECKLNPVISTKKIVDELNSLDTEIIVASNSSTEKIKYLFSKADVSVTDELSAARGSVHARGGAGKFVIDNSFSVIPEYLEINSVYKVALRRSSYHKILSDEKPDYVIGDVFSLDLALPLYLRMNDKSYSDLKVIQRVQKYTPDWVIEYLKKKEFEGIAFTVNSIDEVPELISGRKQNS